VRWLALALAASACLGCSPVGTDLCAGVTCAVGRECVGGICLSRDLATADLLPPDAPSWLLPDAATDYPGVGADATPDLPPQDASSCVPGKKELVVKVHVEGLSYLRIQDNQAWWYHVTYSAPGRTVTPPHPTTINGVTWTPTWPFGSGSGKNCVCESSKFDLCAAGVALGAAPKYSSLTKISGPGLVVLVQAPFKGNGYRTVVEVHDTPYWSAWYEFKLTFN